MKVATMNREQMGKILVAGVMASLVALVVSCKTGTKAPAPQPSATLPPAAVEPLPPPSAAPVKADELTVQPPPPAAVTTPVTEEDGAAGIVVDHKNKAVKGGDKKSASTGHAKSSYVVVKGDSLSKIAKKHGVTVAALAAANDMKITDILRLGKKLEIPAADAKGAAHKATKEAKETKVSTKAPTAKKVATTKDTKKKHSTKKAEAATATPTDAAAPAASAGGKYVVQKNDNPWIIAKKLHVKRADLLAANNLTDKSMLHIGQELTVPAGGAATAATPAAATPAGEATGAAPAPEAAGATPAAATKKVTGEMAAPPAAASTTSFDHVVADGETLKVIADSYGVTVEDIQKANPAIKSDADLKPNGTIVIPTK